jgi:hypothetical protein
MPFTVLPRRFFTMKSMKGHEGISSMRSMSSMVEITCYNREMSSSRWKISSFGRSV